MKYLFQFGIICVITLTGEILYTLIPLPIPSSIYGLLILLLLLMTKRIKLEQVEDIANFFLAILPILFLPASVGLMTIGDTLNGQGILVICMIIFSTIAVSIVTGHVAQSIIRMQKRAKERKTDE